MLHLENFFEKSFALLLTTPKFSKKRNLIFQFLEDRIIMVAAKVRRLRLPFAII